MQNVCAVISVQDFPAVDLWITDVKVQAVAERNRKHDSNNSNTAAVYGLSPGCRLRIF